MRTGSDQTLNPPVTGITAIIHTPTEPQLETRSYAGFGILGDGTVTQHQMVISQRKNVYSKLNVI
jgi:hypothetical protein